MKSKAGSRKRVPGKTQAERISEKSRVSVVVVQQWLKGKYVEPKVAKKIEKAWASDCLEAE